MSKSKIEKGKAALKKAKKQKPVRRTTKRTATTTIKTTASTTIVKATAPPLRLLAPFEWKKPFILGLKLDDPAKKVLLEADYSFDNIHELIAKHHPGCDAFVYNSPQVSGSSADMLVPVMVAILVPSGETPPSFIGRPSPQQGTETILSMKDLNLTWKLDISKPQVARAGGGGGGRVFTLQCSLQRNTKASLGAIGEAALYDYEHGTPFIIKPSIQATEKPVFTFELTLPNGDEVDGEFPGGTEEAKTKFIGKFLRLNEDNVEHFNLVKAAIDEVIQKKLDAAQEKKDLLADYDDKTLESMYCIKMYPNNVAHGFHSDYVSKYYSKAIATYALDTNCSVDTTMDIWGNAT